MHNASNNDDDPPSPRDHRSLPSYTQLLLSLAVPDPTLPLPPPPPHPLARDLVLLPLRTTTRLSNAFTSGSGSTFAPAPGIALIDAHLATPFQQQHPLTSHPPEQHAPYQRSDQQSSPPRTAAARRDPPSRLANTNVFRLPVLGEPGPSRSHAIPTSSHMSPPPLPEQGPEALRTSTVTTRPIVPVAIETSPQASPEQQSTTPQTATPTFQLCWERAPPRTYRACAQCRARKVKCDTEPGQSHCRRCRERGQHCSEAIPISPLVMNPMVNTPKKTKSPRKSEAETPGGSSAPSPTKQGLGLEAHTFDEAEPEREEGWIPSILRPPEPTSPHTSTSREIHRHGQPSVQSPVTPFSPGERHRPRMNSITSRHHISPSTTQTSPPRRDSREDLNRNSVHFQEQTHQDGQAGASDEIPTPRQRRLSQTLAESNHPRATSSPGSGSSSYLHYSHNRSIPHHASSYFQEEGGRGAEMTLSPILSATVSPTSPPDQTHLEPLTFRTSQGSVGPIRTARRNTVNANPFQTPPRTRSNTSSSSSFNHHRRRSSESNSTADWIATQNSQFSRGTRSPSNFLSIALGPDAGPSTSSPNVLRAVRELSVELAAGSEADIFIHANQGDEDDVEMS